MNNQELNNNQNIEANSNNVDLHIEQMDGQNNNFDSQVQKPKSGNRVLVTILAVLLVAAVGVILFLTFNQDKNDDNTNVQSTLTIDSEIEEKTIKITITGQNYDYTLLPDNSKTVNKSFTYEVKENGNYLFKIYDLYNNEYKKEIKVD